MTIINRLRACCQAFAQEWRLHGRLIRLTGQRGRLPF